MHPDYPGASQEEIRLKISPPINQRLYESILESLKNEGKIGIHTGKIMLVGFQVTLSKKQKQIYDRLDEICKSYHFRSFPSNVLQTIKDCYGENEVEGVLRLMIGERRLVRLNNRRLVHADAIEDFKRILRNHVKKNGQIELKESMEVFGVGRPQVQPIFDYLDSIQYTRRIGDYRVLHKTEETKHA
jgi:selenocysteine-specific elongation factor